MFHGRHLLLGGPNDQGDWRHASPECRLCRIYLNLESLLTMYFLGGYTPAAQSMCSKQECPNLHLFVDKLNLTNVSHSLQKV